MTPEEGGAKSWVSARVKLSFRSSEALGQGGREDGGESGTGITYHRRPVRDNERERVPLQIETEG